MSRPTSALATLGLFVLLAIVHTWPLATNPGGLSRNDTADTVHHEWILAWDAHALATNPLGLFDTNTFYPEKDTLAYSDHIIIQALFAAPLIWLGASPVLAYNIVLILGLALTGWTTSLLVERWTGRWRAGVLSGSLMAFNAMTLTRFAEIQDQHFEFFPLALLAFDRLLTVPRVKEALAFAVWFAVQALTCGYLLVFTAISFAAAFLVRPGDWMGARFRRLALMLALSVVLASVILLPFLVPYLRVSQGQGFTRAPAEVALYSAHFTDYLATGGRLHFSLWSHRFFDREGLFPGLIAMALVIIAIAAGVGWRDRRARMALAFGIVAFAMSFGPAFPLYGPIGKLFPIMAGIRGASRFGQLFLAAVAILAGFGIAWILRPECQDRRLLRAVVAAFCILGVHVEAVRAPINYRAFTGLSPIFGDLEPGHELVACFPFPHPPEESTNVDCMLASTQFWQPLLNGYSSFIPARYYRHADALDAFPEGNTLAYLKAQGVTAIIVFTNRLSAPRVAHLAEHSELVLWRADGPIRIYRLQ